MSEREIEPGFLRAEGDGWVFVRAPRFWFCTSIQPGMVLVNEPWNQDWYRTTREIAQWSIYAPPNKDRRWGIPTEWAMEILEASGSMFRTVPTPAVDGAE
jgi:hypothetical protein